MHSTLNRKPSLVILGLLLIALLFIAGGCRPSDAGSGTPNGKSTSDSNQNQQQPYNIVTTTGMITDIVEQIAGDHASVTGLINSGIDPHLYQPTRSDIQSLMNADIVFYNGLHLEGKMTDAFERIAQQTKAFAVTAQLDRQQLLAPEEYEGNYDPHVWMDPQAWGSAAKVIANALITHDPQNESSYTANLETLQSQIADLHQYALDSIASIPEDQRVLVTAHDAFSYFGNRYGFEVVGIQGISTESEAGVRDIERLVELLVTRKIRAVFVESTVSYRNIQALIAGAKGRGHDVIVGGELYSDAMGEPGTYEGTYIGMIDHNITIITRALGGQAPADGMNGKLAHDKP